MNWLLLCLLSIMAILIFYQDLTTRSVAWPLFPAIAIVGMMNAYLQLGAWQPVLINAVINAGIVLLQLIALQVYFFVKQGGRALIINKQLGLGDMLFLLACCCFFSPANFLAFYCLGLVFSLLIHLALQAMGQRGRSGTIPLAGYQAIFLLLFISVYIFFHAEVTNDAWLLNHLLPS